MKLTKENVYINLQGKSKEELTDLYWLLKNNNEPLSKNRCLDGFIIYYFNGSHKNLGLEYGFWQYTFTKNKQEVTIEQLKEIIKPMETEEFEKLFNYAKSVDFKISDLAVYINKEISFDYYDQLEGDEPEDKAHLFALKYKDIDLSLEQQLQKAEAEVERLQSLIEEENKPKVGDWAMLWEEDEKTPIFGLITDVTDYFLTCNGSWEYAKKITNPQLIKLLENECSTKN